MQARAGAIDELMASGALDDMVAGPHDDIQAELDRMGAGHDVDAELARMKGELSQGGAPKQIEGADGASAAGAVNDAVNDAKPTQASPADQPQAGDGA